MYLIGYDSVTSSIKATLMDAETGSVVASATSPKKEAYVRPIRNPRPSLEPQRT